MSLAIIVVLRHVTNQLARGPQYTYILGNTETKCRILSPDPEHVHMPERTEFAVLREKAELSVDVAARLIGKSPRTVHRYEFPGKSGTVPSFLVIEALKRAVNDRCSHSTLVMDITP